MKKLLCALLALAMVLSLAACGGAKAEPVTYNDAGYYSIFSITEGDETMSQAEFADLEWIVYLQLNDDGTGVLDLDDGDVTELTWQDGSITADGETVPYVLAGGLLTLDLSDDEGAFIMVFQKGDAPAEDSDNGQSVFGQMPDAAQETETVDLSGIVGTYELTAIDGEPLSDEDLSAMETLGFYRIALAEDGTGVLSAFGNVTDLTWDETSLTAEGETVEYTYSDDVLTLDDTGGVLTLNRISDTADIDGLSATVNDSETAGEPVEMAPLPAGDFEPVEGDLDGFHVAIVGAEPFVNSDGKDAVRFYYDFTNNSDEATYAWLALYFQGAEDGTSLESAYSPWDERVPEDENEDLRIEPGVTIRCTHSYLYDPDGSVLSFSLQSFIMDEDVTAVFDVSALPGRPAEDLEIVPIEDPQFFSGYPTAASTDNIAAELLSVDAVSGYADEACVRAVFSLTNNTEDTASPLWLTTARAYQDGIELVSTYTEDEDGLEDAYYDDMEPGSTTEFACAWTLRSDSPVEITLQDYTDYSSDILIADIAPLG